MVRGRARSRGEVCDHPRGEEEEGEEGEESKEGKARLQRMKVQSRRTFKFRKTRKRDRGMEPPLEMPAGGAEQEPPEPKPKTKVG